jgi:ribosome-binding protein aMBF1 (putative translation factor)
VIYAAFPLTLQAKPLPGAIDIDDLVAELEQSPAAAKAIADGRKWVADTFYADRPDSIAQLRLRKGWSQAELAKRADTSQPYIARLEMNRVDPQLSTLRKIARALGVPAATLMQAIYPGEAP